MEKARDKSIEALPKRIAGLEARLTKHGMPFQAEQLRKEYELLKVDYLLAVQNVMASYRGRIK